MDIARDATRSPEDVISTLLPVAMFYACSRASFFHYAGEYWAGKVFETNDNSCKMLRRDGFTLAEERYGACCLPRIRTP